MIELNDQNFKEELKKEKLVVVDFFATWCSPCLQLVPILEKIEKDLEGEVYFMKANVDNIPSIAREFNVDRIPFVVLFYKEELIRAFVGLKPEEEIKEWILKDPNIEKILRDSEDYAKENNFRLNPNQDILNGIINGLARNQQKHGEKYCPCRRITGEKEQDAKNICPCVFCKKEIEDNGICSCGLFLK